jgi:hypothetical protein
MTRFDPMNDLAPTPTAALRPGRAPASAAPLRLLLGIGQDRLEQARELAWQLLRQGRAWAYAARAALLAREARFTEAGASLQAAIERDPANGCLRDLHARLEAMASRAAAFLASSTSAAKPDSRPGSSS